ncbi:unnamed protein product [Euphydryas editha]|uniref:Uncharacterized protein n=1 Tax=Euphydryas editha TaxID=104508 RepID=A0AAU9V7D0_EUPED|nr:unnamed protein product [Euphydryas editha]
MRQTRGVIEATEKDETREDWLLVVALTLCEAARSPFDIIRERVCGGARVCGGRRGVRELVIMQAETRRRRQPAATRFVSTSYRDS